MVLLLRETASVASSLFQNTDEAIVENGSSVAAVVADDGERERRGRGRKERVFPPSSIDGRSAFRVRGGTRLSVRRGKREGRGRKGGGWMMAAGALGFVQRATRRATQPARKNLAAREAGRQGTGEGGRE